MPMTTELYMALLAMDSYNRGYGERLDVVAAGASATQIGNAIVSNKSNTLTDSPEVAAGFFAQSYTLNGQKIISYRGTDQVITPPWSDSPGSDLWNGYGTAFGLPFNDQARMAADFFQTVTGTQTTDPSAGNAILTGHSLGGGLAGFIGSIYRQQAYLFDNMSFELAANTAREAGLINNALGINIFTDFYNGLAPPSTQIGGNLHAFATTGELLGAIGNRFSQTTPVLKLDPFGSGLSMVQLHSMALHTILRFAADELAAGRMTSDWSAIGPQLWNAGFNIAVANAAMAGRPQLAGAYSNEYKMLSAIAYSTIDEGTRVFGDVAIRSMFNDANDLGKIAGLANGSASIKAGAGALAEILMQFAGIMAFNKVLMQAHPEALQGIIAVTPTVLTVDFSDVLWSFGAANGAAQPDIIGRKTLVEQVMGVAGATVSDTHSGMTWLWAGNDAVLRADPSKIIDRIAMATTDTPATVTIPDRALPSTHATLYAGGGGTDDIRGSRDNDFIFGGDGNDIIRGMAGDDLLAGGKGDDRLFGGLGQDYLAGGEGKDTAFYEGYGSQGLLLDVRWATEENNNPAIEIVIGSDVDRLIQIEKVELTGFSDVVHIVDPISNFGFSGTIDGMGQSTQQGDTLNFSDSTVGLLIGKAWSGWFGGGDAADAVEIYTGRDAISSWFQWVVSLFSSSDNPLQVDGLFGQTGLRFANFENVIGSSHDDVLGLWWLNPGGKLDAAQEVIWRAANHLPSWADSINGMATYAAARVTAAAVITQNQLAVNIHGGAGNDVIVGTRTGIDSISGDAGDDRLYAGGFDSTLFGNDGDDYLHGGGLKSQLYGGVGKDVFYLSNNTTVMDATSEDYVAWYGVQLTGGVQETWDESGWAYYSPVGAVVNHFGFASYVGGGFLTLAANLFDAVGMLWARYAVNDGGQMAIQMCGGLLGQAVLNGYDFNPKGASTGNIEVLRIVQTDNYTAALIKEFLSKAIKQSTGFTPLGTDPLVIDLDRDGLELTRQGDGVYFDIDNDGFAEHTGWVGGDDGLLARDVNGNGKIDAQSELFGNAAVSGFTALATLDSNGDGVINAADTGFNTLRVWRDVNGNGQTDAGELKTLAESGITAISLATSVPASSIILGNTVRAVATVTFASGLTSTISDVVLESNQLDSVFLGNAAVSTAAAASLKLKGYGNTTNLDVAMTNDAGLLTLVNGFKAMSASSSWDTLKAAADDILFRWAGVSGVTPTAMTSAFDLQKLAFLEAFSEVLVRRNGIGVHTDFEVANDNTQIDANAVCKAA